MPHAKAESRFGFLKDEQGNWSMGRLCLAAHTMQTWVGAWLILSGIITVKLDVMIAVLGVYTTMFIVFGGWVIGPRSFQYLFPVVGKLFEAAGSAAARLGERAEKTDNVRTDDERG